MSIFNNKFYDTREQMEERKARYERNKMPYTLRTTSSSTEIRSDQMKHTHIATTTFLSQKDRNFMGRVTSDIRRRLANNLIKVPSKDPIKYNFCQVNTAIQDYSKITEIDINSCFWNSAKLQGIISDSTYLATDPDDSLIRLSEFCIKNRFPKVKPDKYFKILSKSSGMITIIIDKKEEHLFSNEFHYKYRPTKEVRLAALGALAKQVTCYYFDGVSLKQTHIEKPNEIEARLWKMICHKVYALFDKIMKTIPEKDFILYWVDALIVKESSKDFVIKMIQNEGFTCKEKKILGATLGQGTITVNDVGGKKRTFKFKTK